MPELYAGKVAVLFERDGDALKMSVTALIDQKEDLEVQEFIAGFATMIAELCTRASERLAD